MSVNYTPEKKEYKNLTPFKLLCLQNFPYIEEDFDALTNYGLLCKIVEYLNNVISNENAVESNVTALYNAFVSLNNYVSDYFDNLDVQDEINHKLDVMASNGQLSALIQPLFNNYKGDIENTIGVQNNRIAQIENAISSIENGTPLVASSTSGMTDTSKIYINTSDGNWYYYSGSSWISGGTYQSLGIADNIIDTKNLNAILRKNFTDIYEKEDISNIQRNAGKYIQASNGVDDVYSLYSTTSYINCIPGEKYYSTGVGLAPNIAIVAFYNANNVFISSVAYTESLKGRPFVVPNGASKMRLSYTTNTGIDLFKFKEVKVNGLNRLNYNDMDSVFKNTFEPVYENIDNLNWITGYFVNRNGSISSYSAMQYTELPVIPGEKIILTGSSESYQVLYQYVLNGQIVSFPESGTSVVQHTDVEVIIPDGVYLLRISNNFNKPYSVKKAKYYNVKNVESESYDVKQLKIFNIENQLKNDFAWSNALSNAKYVTFTFDDSLPDIDLVENLFESKGVPCCFATIPERLNNSTTNGETVKQVLDRCIVHGGEVLSHSNSYLTSSSTDADYQKIYVTNKKLLENAGFEVNGIITAGGDGAYTQDFTKDTLIARNNYLYGDLTSYNDHSIEQYYNPRQDIYNLAYHKSQIDQYVAGTYSPNSKWMNYLMHSTTTFTIQALGELIDYCIQKGVTIATWKTIYNTFKSSKLEERIKNILKKD